MSQNITLWGASYSAVPAVTLPKTGGGTASFTDVTDTTAAAAGLYTPKAASDPQALLLEYAGTNKHRGNVRVVW